MDKITTLHQSGFKNCSQSLEMASQIPSDAVKSYKRRHQNFGDGVRTIKRLLDDLRVTAARVCVTAAKLKPSHEGYQNTIELSDGNNVVPLRSDTIWLVQNGCLFHELWSEDPNQHLRDFLKLVDSLDLDVTNRERTRMRLFQFSLRDQASNWLERLPAGGSYYTFPCLILSIKKDCKTPK
ncbi:hypothetical protein Tco_1446655 [Tanacetum coccineum]